MPRHKENPLKPAADALSELARTIDALEDFDADDLAARVEESLQKPLQDHREKQAAEVRQSIASVRARLKQWADKEVAPLLSLLGEAVPEDPIEVFELLLKRDPKRYDQPAVRELVETIRTQTAAVEAVEELGGNMSRRRRKKPDKKRPGDFSRGLISSDGKVEKFILREAAKKRGVRSGDITKKFNIAREGVRLVFHRLITQGVLRMEGDRSTARYFLASQRRK